MIQPRAKVAAADINTYFDKLQYTIAPIADLTDMHIYVYE